MFTRASAPLFAIVIGAQSIFCSQAQAKPRTKSHRTRSSNLEATRQRKGAASAASESSGSGRWTPEAAKAIEQLLASRGKGSDGYSALDPPVAILTLSAAVAGSIGESLFYHLVTRAEFKFSDDFWALVPVQYGGARARVAYEGFHRQPRAVWEKDPYYHIYRKTLFRCHESIRRDWGEKKCAEWRARLLIGFPEAELRPYIRGILTEELRRPVGLDIVKESSQDPAPVRVRAGLRRIPEMEMLCRKLKERGFDIWVMSGAYQWAAEEVAGEYGIHPSRVIGVRSKVSADGILTGNTLMPIPKGAGLAEAVTMFIGRAPALAVGRKEDSPLLDFGRGLRILLVDAAGGGGAPSGREAWLVQRGFISDGMSQERVLPETVPGGEIFGVSE